MYGKFNAVLSGAKLFTAHPVEFSTITAARKWAESHGTEADSCAIYRTNRNGEDRLVARHVRDTTGTGLRWYRAPLQLPVNRVAEQAKYDHACRYAD